MTEEQPTTTTDVETTEAPAAPEAPTPQTAAPEAPASEAATTAAPPTPQPAPRPAGEDKHGGFIWGLGRRKTSVARVRIRPGSGTFLVNKRELDSYLPRERDRNTARAPLAAVSQSGGWDIWANVKGGGTTGQAGAISLGLARALAKALPDVEPTLRERRLLTRDARMTERKKPGQPGARKRFQFSKR